MNLFFICTIGFNGKDGLSKFEKAVLVENIILAVLFILWKQQILPPQGQVDVRAEVIINAPVDAVWAVFMDWDKYPEWAVHSGAHNVGIIGDKFPGSVVGHPILFQNRLIYPENIEGKEGLWLTDPAYLKRKGLDSAERTSFWGTNTDAQPWPCGLSSNVCASLN